MSDEIRDIDTLFDDQKKYEMFINLLKETQKRAKETAEIMVDGFKKANQVVMEKVEKNIKLTPNDKKDILAHEKDLLKKKLMKEVVQTKASMILVQNRIGELTNKKEALVPEAAITTGYEQVVLKGRIKANESMILKLQLQQQYLEGILSELLAALKQIREMIMIDKVTPISENIRDLLTEVDRIQAESDVLAGIDEETSSDSEALKDLNEEN